VCALLPCTPTTVGVGVSIEAPLLSSAVLLHHTNDLTSNRASVKRALVDRSKTVVAFQKNFPECVSFNVDVM